MARDTILAVGAAIILGYGGWLVYLDQFLHPIAGGMTVGTLIIFMDYLRKLWDPLKWLTEFFAKVRLFEAATPRVFRVLDQPEPIIDRPGAVSLAIKPRTLKLDRISFAYRRGERPVLSEISAEIEPGQMVAFVGASGGGKSTLLNLMMRYFDPTSGTLLLDGIDARTVEIDSFRGHMALVSQDSLLLPGTIAQNIAYGRAKASSEEIAAAARLAGASGFIDSMPEGYATIVAEGGANLSGGQRQRIAIARALITSSPILILDEPTSALDPQNEQRLIEALHTLKRRRTIVLVTHRLESVVACDTIFVLEAGRIVERGTHSQLATRAGRYAGALRRERANVRSGGR